MKQNEINKLAGDLVAKYGLALRIPVALSADGHSFSLEPDGVHVNESFRLAVRLGWRNIEIEFIGGKFSADLIQEMGNMPEERKRLFAIQALKLTDRRGSLKFIINEKACDPTNPASWPHLWRTFNFSVTKSPIDVNTENHTRTTEVVTEWVDMVYAAILAISPLEEIDIPENQHGLPEGAVVKIEVNKYERSRFNRAMCLNHYGAKCQVCAFDFEDTYGSIGTGFIHVHHIVPVSQLGANYIVNPITDLIPVCANCHAMMHRRDPPFSVGELQAAIMHTSS